MGDNNSNPLDGDSVPGAIEQLLDARRVVETYPAGRSAVLAEQAQGGANAGRKSDPYFDTGDFDDVVPGNLRTDYVLPSKGLLPRHAEVFSLVPSGPPARLNDASDHHLVRVDVLVGLR